MHATLRRKLIAVGIAVIAIPLVMGATFAYFLTNDDGCANSMLSESRSPDGNYKAVVFERSCGATTGFSTQVSVLPIDVTQPRSGGNALAVDTDHGAAPSGRGGGPTVKADWLSAYDLQLTYHPKARTYAAAKQVEKIRITHTLSAENGG
jgi:hypothetical protein